MNTAFDAAKVAITRKRFSTTQGEVLVEYAGTRIEQYGDKIELRDGEWAGHDDAFWIAVAKREALARGLATGPTPPAPVALTDRQEVALKAAVEKGGAWYGRTGSLTGGAYRRMCLALTERGLLDHAAPFPITDAGRAALAARKAERRDRAYRRGEAWAMNEVHAEVEAEKAEVGKPAAPDSRTREEVIASVVKSLAEAIDRLDACSSSPAGADTILAWKNGLAVKLSGSTPMAVSIDAADRIEKADGDFAYPVVMNGNRETALPTRRGEAAKLQASKLRNSLAEGWPASVI